MSSQTSQLYCKPVSLTKDFDAIKDRTWEITDEFLEENKIDFLAHDSEDEVEDVYHFLKERGMFLSTQREDQWGFGYNFKNY